MISLIIGLIATNYYPALDEPNMANQQRMANIVTLVREADQKVEEIQQGVAQPGAEATEVAYKSEGPPLPFISGRLLEDDALVELRAQAEEQVQATRIESLPVEPDVSLLKLVGIIDTGTGRIGLINDGETEHVVSTGSYLLGTLRVVEVARDKVVVVFAGRVEGLPEQYEISMPSL